jgi:hypothetical protein
MLGVGSLSIILSGCASNNVDSVENAKIMPTLYVTLTPSTTPIVVPVLLQSDKIKEFASLSDLLSWLQQDNTHTQVYSSTFTCTDFALMMSEHAIQDGYWIFPAVDLSDGHMRCITLIGNDLYAIEPQINTVTLWAEGCTP